MMAEYDGRRVQLKHHGSRILHIGNVVRGRVRVPERPSPRLGVLGV